MTGYTKQIDENDLEAVLDKLSPSSRPFAESLIHGCREYGGTPKQLYWVVRLHRRALGLDEETGEPRTSSPAPGKPDTPNVAIAKELIAAFTKTGGMMPKLFVKAPDGNTYKFSRLGPTSKYKGDIGVSISHGGAYLGRICWDTGRFWAHRTAQSPDVGFAALKAFLADPQAKAKEYGDTEHHCCFCAEPLTDPRSTFAGYGPICAGKYGLPWGETGEEEPEQHTAQEKAAARMEA